MISRFSIIRFLVWSFLYLCILGGLKASHKNEIMSAAWFTAALLLYNLIDWIDKFEIKNDK
jgi:hypothetical protein